MKYIKNFDEIGLNDIGLVGGKNASLGEMYQHLVPKGIKIPPGFVITAEAYSLIVNEGLQNHIKKLLNFDFSDVSLLDLRSEEIREMIHAAEFPPALIENIDAAYELLKKKCGKEAIEVSVRSSATAEDLPEASFAGQQETFLNVRNKNELLDCCKKCFASLYTARAISYRNSRKIDHSKVKLSIGVQTMIRSDLASSGVIFTIDPESGARNVILVTSSLGLGENIVGGKVDPDEFLVSKDVLMTARMPILRRKIGLKQFRLQYAHHGFQRTKNVEVSLSDRMKPSITDTEVLSLSKQALLIEKYFSHYHGKYTPMDIEWAKDGESGELYILQARPETVHSIAKKMQTVMKLEKRSRIIVKGRSVGTKIGTGRAKVVDFKNDLQKVNPGDILVTDMTDPDWEPVMKKAAGIITNRGGRTCHAAIISREHGIPCIVGTGTATDLIKTGDEITVSCADGETGLVYEGILPVNVENISSRDIPKLRTKVMVNLGNPDEAIKASVLPVDGVGLMRMEFMITELVKIHPMALMHPEKLSQAERNAMLSVPGFDSEDPRKFFITKLAEGIGTIAGAFYPRPVIVRFSDFKTNEYANLVGGSSFEPSEENPMIGFRGASRYYSPRYKEGFALECAAIKYVIEEMGMKNLKLMIPFCRTVEEGKKVIHEMAINGLHQGENGLEIYVMCEIPSNVLDADSFAEIFDGFSIGSNDLTQLTLGVDRDSEILSDLFDERDRAALKMIGMAVQEGVKNNIPVGICGQAPSDYPEICEYLVKLGITSISLTPDSVFEAIFRIKEAESGHSKHYPQMHHH